MLQEYGFFREEMLLPLAPLFIPPILEMDLGLQWGKDCRTPVKVRLEQLEIIKQMIGSTMLSIPSTKGSTPSVRRKPQSGGTPSNPENRCRRIRGPRGTFAGLVLRGGNPVRLPGAGLMQHRPLPALAKPSRGVYPLDKAGKKDLKVALFLHV